MVDRPIEAPSTIPRLLHFDLEPRRHKIDARRIPKFILARNQPITVL